MNDSCKGNDKCLFSLERSMQTQLCHVQLLGIYDDTMHILYSTKHVEMLHSSPHKSHYILLIHHI